MEYKKVSVSESIAYGFKTTVNNFRLFFLASLIELGVFIVGCIVAIFALGISIGDFKLIGSKLLQGCQGAECTAALQHFLSSVTIHLIPFVLIILVLATIWVGLGAGYIKMVLRLYDTGTSAVSNMFSCFGLAPRMLLAVILYFLIVGIGIVLFVLPGLYWAFRFAFAMTAIVDKNMRIMDAFKYSWRITAHHGWEFLSLWLVFFLISRLSMPLSLLLAVISLMSYVYMYRHMQALYEQSKAV